jgi:FtsH-binding integral membrane protein
VSNRTIKPVRIEPLLAGVLNFGTWLASVVIAAGLVLSLFQERTPFPTSAQVVTAGIGLFILLPILRVILMLTIFVKQRDYKFAAAAAVVLLIIFAGFAIGTLSK